MGRVSSWKETFLLDGPGHFSYCLSNEPARVPTLTRSPASKPSPSTPRLRAAPRRRTVASAFAPARPTVPRARARARRAWQPSALSWRRGVVSVGIGTFTRAVAGLAVAVATSSPPAASAAASIAPAGAVFAKAERRGRAGQEAMEFCAAADSRGAE